MKLRYLYVGCKAVKKELEFQTGVLGHQLKWYFDRFGAQVASLRTGEGPELLLADHLKTGSCIYIYEVENMKEAEAQLKAGGAKLGLSLEIPGGPCRRFVSPTGQEGAIFKEERKEAMESSYADPENAARRFL